MTTPTPEQDIRELFIRELFERCARVAFSDPRIVDELQAQFTWALTHSVGHLRTEFRELFLSEARAAMSKAIADYLATHDLETLLSQAAGDLLRTYGVRDLMRTRRAIAKTDLIRNPQREVN